MEKNNNSLPPFLLFRLYREHQSHLLPQQVLLVLSTPVYLNNQVNQAVQGDPLDLQNLEDLLLQYRCYQVHQWDQDLPVKKIKRISV